MSKHTCTHGTAHTLPLTLPSCQLLRTRIAHPEKHTSKCSQVLKWPKSILLFHTHLTIPQGCGGGNISTPPVIRAHTNFSPLPSQPCRGSSCLLLPQQGPFLLLLPPSSSYLEQTQALPNPYPSINIQPETPDLPLCPKDSGYCQGMAAWLFYMAVLMV